MSISLSSLVNPSQLTLGTAQTLSGTAVGFTGIPTGVKQIQLILQNISVSATARIYIQLGSGSYTTTGYNSYCLSIASSGTITKEGSTSGFDMATGVGSDYAWTIVNLINITNNNWQCNFTTCGYSGSTTFAFINSGNINLSGVLDRVRITTSNGTDTFDAGTANITYQ